MAVALATMTAARSEAAGAVSGAATGTRARIGGPVSRGSDTGRSEQPARIIVTPETRKARFKRHLTKLL
jgi:hypothetical protein